MLMSTTWEQTAIYNPDDPTQRNRVVYAPGGYTSYYWNRVPDAGVLNGLNGFTSWPLAAQIGIVGVASAIVGYVGFAKYGHKLKPALKRIGLAGRRR